MNKKILIVFVVLLLAPLVLAPLITGAPRKKSFVHIAAYNAQYLDGDKKETNGITMKSSRMGFDLFVAGPDDGPPIPLPHYGGTADVLIIRKFDPETGFGTVEVKGVFDFGELGFFEIHGKGNCGGAIQPDPHTPPSPAIYYQGEILGYGRGDLQGTLLNLIWSLVSKFPWWFPGAIEDQEGLLMVGEISY